MIPFRRTAFVIASTLLAGLSSAQVSPETEPLAAAPVSVEPLAGDSAEAAAPLYQGSVPVDVEIPEGNTSVEASKKLKSRLIEEIVVTAQKREQNLFDVPQAVTAFSNEKLEAMGIQSVQDLQKITPGLTVSNVVGFTVAFLRGVGTDAFLPGADSSVPFYIDGIPLLATQGGIDSLGRIERIEVLKGPQGTLFGTNSVGGAINIITPDPENSFGGDVSFGLGNYNKRATQGVVNVPVTDSIAMSASGFYSDQDNFYVNDDPAGPAAPDINQAGTRVKLRWNLSDNISNTVYASYSEAHSSGGLNFENTFVPPALRALLPQDPKADRHYSMNSAAKSDTYSSLFADTFAWNFEKLDAKLIGSWQRLRANAAADFDASSTPVIGATTPGQLGKQYTAELQISSNQDTPFTDHLTWVGGLFYIYSGGGFAPVAFNVAPGVTTGLLGTQIGGALNTLLQPVLSPTLGFSPDNGYSLLTSGYLSGYTVAQYFQGTLKLTDNFNVILGERFQHTERDLTRSYTAITSPLIPNGKQNVIANDVATLKANQLSPRVGIQWFFVDEAQLYASWARGYKSPTYNSLNITGELVHPINEVKPTKVDAFELGIKSQLLDNTLTLNTAIFYTKEKQLLTGFISILTGGIVAFDNVPAGRIYGAEFDALWQALPEINPGLVFTASGTVLDAKYTEYPNGRGYDAESGLPFGDGFPIPPFPARDFSGNRIVRTPKYSGNFGISQTIYLGENSLELATDVAYSSNFYFLPQGGKEYEQKEHYLLNAHLTYNYAPYNLAVTAMASNITDQSYNESQFTSEFGRNALLNAPRTYGLATKWSF